MAENMQDERLKFPIKYGDKEKIRKLVSDYFLTRMRLKQPGSVKFHFDNDGKIVEPVEELRIHR